MFQKTQFISILQLCLGMKYAAYFKLPMSFSTSLSCAFCNMSWSTIKKIKQKPNKYRESDTIHKIRNEVSSLFLNSWYSTIEDTNTISINFNKFGKKVWESSTNIVILINLIKVLKWGNYITLLFSRVCSQNFGSFSFDSYEYNLLEARNKFLFTNLLYVSTGGSQEDGPSMVQFSWKIVFSLFFLLFFSIFCSKFAVCHIEMCF